MKKRTAALAMVLLLALVPGALAAELNDVGVYPITQETEVLTILMQQDVLVEDYDTNAFTLWIEESCGVDLQFELLPAGNDGTDKLALMLSSGQALPDVINMPMSVLQDYIYGTAGIFIDLTDYYEDYAYYFNQRAAQYPDIDFLGPVTAADGKIYSLPRYYNETIGLTSKRLWMNMEFLEALDLEVPTTTEELYQVLKAFQERDPNGNGVNDEIPLLGSSSAELMGYLMNAFIYANPSNNYYTLKDGVIGVSYTEDAFREGLRYMNRLCEEGLLSPLTFSQSFDQYKQTVTGDGETATVGCFVSFSTSLSINNYATSPLTPQYKAIAPLSGPEGVRFTEYTPTISYPQWHVTAYCENPELAFRVGDFLMNEEAFLRARIGEPGVHWEYAEPGMPSFFEGRDAKFTFVSIWNETQNSMWRLNIPTISVDDLDLRYFDGDPTNATYTCAVSWPEYQACIPPEGEYAPALIFTPEEVDAISEIQSTLGTYVGECIARFVTGDMDIENDWESFQNELDAIGLELFLETSQTAYDRMMG